MTVLNLFFSLMTKEIMPSPGIYRTKNNKNSSSISLIRQYTTVLMIDCFPIFTKRLLQMKMIASFKMSDSLGNALVWLAVRIENLIYGIIDLISYIKKCFFHNVFFFLFYESHSFSSVFSLQACVTMKTGFSLQSADAALVRIPAPRFLWAMPVAVRCF